MLSNSPQSSRLEIRRFSHSCNCGANAIRLPRTRFVTASRSRPLGSTGGPRLGIGYINGAHRILGGVESPATMRGDEGGVVDCGGCWCTHAALKQNHPGLVFDSSGVTTRNGDCIRSRINEITFNCLNGAPCEVKGDLLVQNNTGLPLWWHKAVTGEWPSPTQVLPPGLRWMVINVAQKVPCNAVFRVNVYANQDNTGFVGAYVFRCWACYTGDAASRPPREGQIE